MYCTEKDGESQWLAYCKHTVNKISMEASRWFGAPEAEGPLSKRGQSVAIVKLKGSQNEDISP